MFTAFFAEYPRTIEDLCRPHLLESERPYEAVKTVALAAIDYENFITDMTADRDFLKTCAPLCSAGETMKCLFVCRCGKSGGVLIVPDGAYVRYGAALP